MVAQTVGKLVVRTGLKKDDKKGVLMDTRLEL
jgi:hypothetical protein